jgi:hypothetical protein
MQRLPLLLSFFFFFAPGPAHAAPSDWAEGPGEENGASRDYYNRAGLLAWRNYMGDWEDSAGTAQGDAAFASATVTDDNSEKAVQWDVGGLVQAWIDGTLPNKGMLLRAVGGGGTYNFRSREYSDSALHPSLSVTTGSGTVDLAPEADTFLEPSTYRSMGESDTLKVSDSNNTLLRFDLSAFEPGTAVLSAVLTLTTFEQYGDGSIDIGVFQCAQGHDEPPSDPLMGIAADFENDEGITADPRVIFATGFESDTWADEWTFADGGIDTVTEDADRAFEPFLGRALRVLMAGGGNDALNMGYQFMDETGQEPEEIYFRYYLRLGNDWNQTVDGGKMPGIAGTYGTAGWGGRPSDGTNGWSARGSYHQTVPSSNPLEFSTPMGTYCYHADMEGDYGSIWLWQNDYRGFLYNNHWYSVEQYLRMNTPGANDGVIRAWIDGRLAFEKTDIRFRDVDTLKIEEIWMNVYHGGTAVSPYDQHLFIDSVVIATDYIGPIPGTLSEPDPAEPLSPDLPPDTAADGASDVPADGASDGPGDGSDGGGCGCRTEVSRPAPAASPFMLLLAAFLTAALRRRRPWSP